MKLIGILGLVLALGLVGCGDGGDEDGERQTPAAKTDLDETRATIQRAEKATDAFVATANEAKTAEEFAAAIHELAPEWRACGEKLQKLILDLAAASGDAEAFNAEMNKIDPALARREAAFEAGCEKWAETDVVQEAIGTFLAANAAWEK
jgi:ABC-type transporter Mla subunit MlaD